MRENLNFCPNCGQKIERAIPVHPPPKKLIKWDTGDKMICGGSIIIIIVIILLILFFSLGQQNNFIPPSQPPASNSETSDYGYVSPYVSTNSGGTVYFYCDNELVGWGTCSGSAPLVKISSTGESYVKLKTGYHTFYAVKEDNYTIEISHNVVGDERLSIDLGRLP